MKQIAFVASLLLCLLLCSVSFSTAESLVPASKLPVEPVFEPSKEYAEYTVVEYRIPGIDAVVNCTVNRKGDGSEYYVQCDLYGDNSESRSVLQNDEFVIKVSSSGLMEHITPDVLKMATDQNIWVKTEGTHDDSILPFAPVFTPINGYDEYTTVAYTVDGIDQELLCTISRKADGSEYYLECSLYGDNLRSCTKCSGEVFNIMETSSGLLGIITPSILRKAIDQNIWLPMIETTTVIDASLLLFPPVFSPNNDYDEYTTVPYTIEDIGAELQCTVSRKADGSEYYLECNFYGDDQMTRTSYDGNEFTILEDKTGFMGGNTPDILKLAIEQNIWLPIEK